MCLSQGIVSERNVVFSGSMSSILQRLFLDRCKIFCTPEISTTFIACEARFLGYPGPNVVKKTVLAEILQRRHEPRLETVSFTHSSGTKTKSGQPPLNQGKLSACVFVLESLLHFSRLYGILKSRGNR